MYFDNAGNSVLHGPHQLAKKITTVAWRELHGDEIIGPARLASRIAGNVLPTNAGGEVPFVTEPPVSTETMTINTTAIAVPIPRDTNIMGDG
jgi:hypothetical protein